MKFEILSKIPEPSQTARVEAGFRQLKNGQAKCIRVTGVQNIDSLRVSFYNRGKAIGHKVKTAKSGPTTLLVTSK